MKKVGKQGFDYVGVGVGAVIFNKEGKVFLSLRGQKAKNDRGKWEFPGGSVEFGQTLEETVTREIKEEFGILIKPVKFLEVVDHILPKENQHWVAVSYVCKIVKGTPKILEPEKCAAIGWFSLRELKKLPLADPTILHLKILRKLLRGGNTKVGK